MAMSTYMFVAVLVVTITLMANPTVAFGAGNIASVAKIEGTNWRHGDVEDTLLTILLAASVTGGKSRKFSKSDIRRVYFGNWLRDYSQAVDLASLKMVSVEAVNMLVWILGFLTFGYATREFEVTGDRLGCYRPEEHIDNPKGYGEGFDDPRRFDRRLRGPVDEQRELAIDPETGMKVYIAAENWGIDTSAGFVKQTFRRSIDMARRYARDGNEADFHEALRLLGTGLHTLEDFSAHSNYVELALAEMGERDVFAHVGRNTRIRLQGARSEVDPLVTGTFGGVDFFHSVMGEISDKATQSEVEQLEENLASSNTKKNSTLKDLLAKLPAGVLSGDQDSKVDELEQNAANARMESMKLHPKEPEAFTQEVTRLLGEVRPALLFHDEVMRSISETLDKIPGLDDLVENLQNELNIYVFSLIAPFILPVIKQVKTELKTGSSTVIESSRREQLVVFENDDSSDPTHSMLSKDHFSNVLNNPAGKVASQVVRWAVPQLMECWDDERADVDSVLDRIVSGVFHHPAQRTYHHDRKVTEGRTEMFRIVEEWWNGMSRSDQTQHRAWLSRSGVRQGQNHLEDVHDSGHGCGKPLGLTKQSSGSKHSNTHGGEGDEGFDRLTDQAVGNVGKMASEAVGGGVVGGMVGALFGIGGSVVSGAAKDSFNQKDESGQRQDRPSHQAQGGSEHHAQGRSEHQGRSEYQERTEHGNQGRSEYQSQGRSDHQTQGRTEYGNQGRTEYGNQGRTEYGNQGRTEYGSQGRSEHQSQGRTEYQSQGQAGYASQNQGRSDYESQGRSDYGNQGRTNYENQERNEYDNQSRPNYGNQGRTDYGHGSSGRGESEYGSHDQHSRHKQDDDDKHRHGRKDDDDDKHRHGRKDDDEEHRYGRKDDDDDEKKKKKKKSHERRKSGSRERTEHGQQSYGQQYGQQYGQHGQQHGRPRRDSESSNGRKSDDDDKHKHGRKHHGQENEHGHGHQQDYNRRW